MSDAQFIIFRSGQIRAKLFLNKNLWATLTTTDGFFLVKDFPISLCDAERIAGIRASEIRRKRARQRPHRHAID